VNDVNVSAIQLCLVVPQINWCAQCLPVPNQTDFTSIPSHSLLDAFTDSAISAKVNGEHKEKDLEPWDGGETSATEELEALETDVVSNAFLLVLMISRKQAASLGVPCNRHSLILI